MPKFFLYIIALGALLLLQEFVLNHLSAAGYLAVYIYIMLIILADMQTPGWLMLLLGFATGWLVDVIEGSGGLFAATTTLLAFVRLPIMQWTLGREVVLSGGLPTSTKVGAKRFWTYITLMTLLWTIPFFSLEALGSFNWLYTPLRIVAGSSVTIVLIYILQLPLNHNKYNV